VDNGHAFDRTHLVEVNKTRYQPPIEVKASEDGGTVEYPPRIGIGRNVPDWSLNSDRIPPTYRNSREPLRVDRFLLLVGRQRGSDGGVRHS
jgi:hypothetical protein